MLYGRLATSLPGGGSRLLEVELERIAPDHVNVRALADRLVQRWLERTVELDGMDVRDAFREVTSEDSEARPDLEDDVIGLEIAHPSDDAEDVLVDEEVLAQSLLRRDAHGSRNAVAAFAWVCVASISIGSPRSSASVRSVCTTFAGSFGSAAHGLRREIGTVGLDQDAIGGYRSRGVAKVGGLRVGDVPSERHVVPPLERHRQEPGRREAVEDHRSCERLECSRGIGISLAVVDDDGEIELVGDGELCIE